MNLLVDVKELYGEINLFHIFAAVPKHRFS